ncbi:MAG: translation initiation factor IF-2 subunit beta [Thermoplasmata archaeon]|nr:MAG: translation initiation factor IF-2 subunit beta [Thermoplasmata archaeon]KAA0013974.1 MAG: translation initiation factor IF-2 subunit beta [Thermoplasmata archaeon]
MQKYEYHKLLDRAVEALPKEIVVKERFQMPQGIIFHEGNTTILKNIGEIADRVNREVGQIFSYLLKELGTAGEIDGDRAIFQGKIPESRMQECIKRYVKRYVLCRECGRPDTKLIKKNRTLLLKCEACGAIHPVAGKIKRE